MRERQEPILLFGESETEAFQRLRRLEILEPEVDRGFRNDFQEAMEKVDQAYLDEILKTQGSTEDGKSVHDVKVEDEGTSIEEIKVCSASIRKQNCFCLLDVFFMVATFFSLFHCDLFWKEKK